MEGVPPPSPPFRCLSGQWSPMSREPLRKKEASFDAYCIRPVIHIHVALQILIVFCVQQFLPHLSSADERGMVVLNKDGDFAIIKARWAGFQTRIPPGKGNVSDNQWRSQGGAPVRAPPRPGGVPPQTPEGLCPKPRRGSAPNPAGAPAQTPLLSSLGRRAVAGSGTEPQRPPRPPPPPLAPPPLTHRVALSKYISQIFRETFTLLLPFMHKAESSQS